MTILKKTFRWLSYLIILFVLAYFVPFVLIIFNIKPLIVLSGSMSPTFNKGDIVYYNKTVTSEIKIKDIIAFKTGESIVSHRVVGIENECFITKGDANDVADKKTRCSDEIVGKLASFKIPYLGYYINFVNNNILLLGILSIFILMIDFILANKYKEEL